MIDNASKIIVVKIGSSTLITKSGKLDTDFIDSLANQINYLRQNGWKPIIVSSGAIGCGLEILGLSRRPKDISTLQAAASIGQNKLINAYNKSLSRYDILSSIVLITRLTTRDRKSYLYARDTIKRLLDFNVVPIINENNTISIEQICFGDNDTLAALVSCMIDADLCVIFSDVDGLHEKDPTLNLNAPLISVIDHITPDIISIAGDAGSKLGSGGMITKIRSARILMAAGIKMVICFGKEPQALIKIIHGEYIGTTFLPHKGRHEITPKKLWIALGDSPKGAVKIDDGAKDAIINGGSSLLAVGVCQVIDKFKAGDIIDIKDSSNTIVARGKVSASSSEVILACGRSQQEIKSIELFKELAHKPVVHRDDLVVFE